MELTNEIKKAKQASTEIMLLDDKQRNDLLNYLALLIRDHTKEIISANLIDLSNMDKDNTMYDRLLLNSNRISSIADDVEKVAALSNYLGTVLHNKLMPNGLIINKVVVPMGVVAIIYESRPNVTIDAFSLCFKTGNACILKGGKEAYHTNVALLAIIKQALIKFNINEDVVTLFSANREEIKSLLTANGLVDLCIPRGSKRLIDFVRQNATIPVIETGAGVVHLYFDKYGDIEKGQNIINNAKTRRVSVCNALDCLLIHKDRLNDLYLTVKLLENNNVEVFADQPAYLSLKDHYPDNLLFYADIEDYGREFLSHKIAVKTVDSANQAIEHIRRYSSGHSEAIITEDHDIAKLFTQTIDAAAIYVNASTAFTDGGEFGMGAEIGISTQKLHARGPMGLEALTSYKWIIQGDGQIR